MGTFLLGFGVGVVGGMLMAPEKGEHYRNILASKASEGVGYLKEKSEGLKESASGAVERGKDAVGQSIEKIAYHQPTEVYQR